MKPNGNIELLTPVSPVLWAPLIQQQIRNTFAKEPAEATPDELFKATAGALRPALVDGLLASSARFTAADAKSVYYLSMEFLLGRSLGNNLQNLGIYGVIDAALGELGFRLSDILEAEPDAALGNGGLGRLAACFLDSLAS